MRVTVLLFHWKVTGKLNLHQRFSEAAASLVRCVPHSNEHSSLSISLGHHYRSIQIDVPSQVMRLNWRTLAVSITQQTAIDHRRSDGLVMIKLALILKGEDWTSFHRKKLFTGKLSKLASKNRKPHCNKEKQLWHWLQRQDWVRFQALESRRHT